MNAKNILKLLVEVGCLLSVPFVAMQFDSGVMWTGFDFLVAGVLLFSIGLFYLFLTRNPMSRNRKLVIGGILLVILAVIWTQLAVGSVSQLMHYLLP